MCMIIFSGHQLTEKTMSTIIPVVMLQLYVNSILHWTLSGLILQHIIRRKSMSKGMNKVGSS